MQFKECVFAKLIYNLQIWNMELMKISMKSTKEEMKKSLMGINK